MDARGASRSLMRLALIDENPLFHADFRPA